MPLILIPRAVLTADPVTQEVSCVSDQAVVIEGGTITEVGAAGPICQKYPDAAPQRFENSLLTPGFVNGHHHVGVTPVQHGSPDSPLETWIAARAANVEIDLGVDTAYSAIQMIRSGVTTVQHLQGWYDSDATDPAAAGRAAIDTYRRIGMRASYAKLLRDQNFFIHDDDLALLPELPERWRPRFTSLVEFFRTPLDDTLAAFHTLTERYAEDPLVAIQLGPCNFHWLSDEALSRIGDLSAQTGAPMHLHLLETVYQSQYLDARAGERRLQYLADSGVLGDRLTLGHGTWLRPDDITALNDAGASVCTNCSSNFRLSSGRLPLLDVLDAGVNVGIGIDEAGLNDDRDMLQEMRLIYTVNREPGLSGRRVTAEQVFAMATLGGARTTGFGSGHGTITAGAPADLVLFDENKLRHPFQLGGVGEVELLIARSRTETITDVMIGGQWVMREGELTTVDEAGVVDEVARQCAAVDRDKHCGDREFAVALQRAVHGWFLRRYGL
ncbi:amidohydrolase [Mycolicibacterium duvalii]|uniref:8-oxoguanine deaminase n=1 Tax=Mycolicibacterium duvalii TaxID=39688 RepID=A0A7I7JZK5_9MYCO|nr:amidohydrolase family protein [Mycolicibacterium duvalii]MCV7370302.1 amidohydrolase family protein [Mycolicibacterium duvalii]PEG37272.1 amidohydrolase [Mycolicibacterium duvalii]BBX16522.1 8-oxoguanine deaminase [Mycolicibacterium duvalii]